MQTLGTHIALDLIEIGSIWELLTDLDGFACETGTVLSTQASSGRSFQLLSKPTDLTNEEPSKRVEVRLIEDGYHCWFELSDLLGKAIQRAVFEPAVISSEEIQQRIPAVLSWIEEASRKSNHYLWGGTVGPDFDCSGLVQTAFASQGIWLPRDAYQQESFCQSIELKPNNFESLLQGDLLFFGSNERCTHVAIYKAKGFYWHSSGLHNGRNGIGVDNLYPTDKSIIACHYRSILRGAARVHICHDGTTLA